MVFFKIVDVDFTTTQGVAFYPNPVTNGWVTLRIPIEPNYPYTVTISDLSGRMLQQLTSAQRELPISLEVAAGLYLVRVTSPDYSLMSKLIVK